jgi:hypothetical protein
MHIENNFEWATHQPLIKVIGELYKPKFILELGSGDNSTPLFMKYNSTLISIDNNKEWIDRLKEKYNIDVVFHNLGKIKIEDHLNDLTNNQRSSITKYYKNIEIPNLKPNLLFVDNYTSCRTLAINTIGSKFDIIMFHDCQPSGIPYYAYNLIAIQGIYNIYILRTRISWTSVFIRNKIDEGFNKLNKMIQPYIEEFKNEYNDCGVMELVVNEYK